MEKSLVSIITPCYNMEKTVPRLMDSVISQSYRPIEFILVDDGSTDHSLSVARAYQLKFEMAGIEYHIVHQENQGLGGAINAGLRLVKGEFLCWPDADDYLEATSVAERVAAMEDHPECAVVTSNAYVRNASSIDDAHLLIIDNLKKHADPNQFLYHLNAESIFCPGCHMVRTEQFFEVNPDHSIFPAKHGQNWQMLLPLYFKYKRFFLNKPLYNYIVYPNSMSRGDNDYKSLLNRYNEHEQILRQVIKKIEEVQNTDVTEYSRFLDDKYAKLKMELAIKYSKPEIFMKEYREKQINVGLDTKDFFNYVRNRFPVLNKPLSILYRGGCGYYPSDIPEKLRRKLNSDYTLQNKDAPKVAVLIPVYNGEKYIDQCFGFLLNQRYDNIEVIVVNDGSTDSTEYLLCKYEEIFVKRGFSYKHITQPNSRLAVAMNHALQYVTAEYIMIYEIDDVLYKDAILGKVKFLQLHPEYSMVRNNGYYINSFSECGKRLFVNRKIQDEEKNVFDRIIDGTANNWPASYLIRKDVLFEKLGKEHKIYEHPGGCHLQFMLPMAYNSKVGFIDRPLMGYYIHIDSDSHKGGINAEIRRGFQYEEIRSEVVKRINMPEEVKKQYIEKINRLYAKSRINCALDHKNKKLYREMTDRLAWREFTRRQNWIIGTVKFSIPIKFIRRGFNMLIRICNNIKCNYRYMRQNDKGYLW